MMSMYRILAGVLLLPLIVVAGCGQPAEQPTATAAAPSEPQFASTPVPSATPSSAVPTATALPAASKAPEAIGILFEPGAASTTVSGRVSQLGVTRYALRAFEGQILDAVISSPHRDVLLSIAGADGTALKRYVDGKSRWHGVLPSTQDYYLDAVSIGAATRFTLRVSIAPLAPTPAPEPTRIPAGSRATNASVTGHLLAYGAGLYVLGATEGQTMDAALSAPALDVLLEIRGADGTVLKRHVDGEVAWSGVLPSTQDYFLRILSFGSEADYSLDVTVTTP